MGGSDRITELVRLNFPSFGGGKTSEWNPVAAALADSAPQFAAGVDIKQVVEFVLQESADSELLEELEIFVDLVKIKYGNQHEGVNKRLGIAESVIAKAKGESNG